MTEKTKKIIHNCLIRAYHLGEKAKDPAEILEFFKVLLETALLNNEISKQDIQKFSLFISFIEKFLNGYNYSEQNEAIAINLITAMFAVARWIYETEGLRIPLKCTVREKPLESAMTKCYNRAVNSSTDPIKDRYSILCVTYNNDLESIYTFSNAYFGIVSGLERVQQQRFLSWLETHPLYKNSTKKDQIHSILNATPVDRGNMHGIGGFKPEEHPDFELTKSLCLFLNFLKDYIATPKSNGYRGLQGAFRFDNFYSLLVELRFLTAEMEDNAEYGSAAHNLHKSQQAKASEVELNDIDKEDKEEDDNKSIFHLRPSELAELNMDHFKGYKQPLSDRLNIYTARVLYNGQLTRF